MITINLQPRSVLGAANRLAVALVVVLVGTVLAAPPGFEPYKGARSLCSHHVAGDKMHISWSSWATKDDLAVVVASYEKAIGKQAGTGDKGERTFSDDKDFRLAIYAATAVDDFPRCTEKPKPGEQTIVLISQATR
jgi:hypothetical protein